MIDSIKKTVIYDLDVSVNLLGILKRTPIRKAAGEIGAAYPPNL